jgi:L-histidine N-alpha-methyltransferase
MTYESTDTPSTTQRAAFAADVLIGLDARPKRLPSKYFYDAEGDKLFQAIMRMPEYYLTGCERDIFRTHKQALLDLIGSAPFDVVELGAGDGAKTKILLEHFLDSGAAFRYRPIDISGAVLRQLREDLAKRWPQLRVNTLQGDYFQMLESLNIRENTRKVVLFLGANIGNMRPEEALAFLRRLADGMHAGDLLLIGFDLKKDPQIILDAYNDPAGHTAAFNLNLLRRINRELGGEFQLDAFRHWETYNPATGSARSFLVSQKAQRVWIGALERAFDFHAWEAIAVELSQKYSVPEVEEMAARAGFETIRHLFDPRVYFVDALWKKPSG